MPEYEVSDINHQESYRALLEWPQQAWPGNESHLHRDHEAYHALT